MNPTAYILTHHGSNFDVSLLEKRLETFANPVIIWNRHNPADHHMSGLDLLAYPIGILSVEIAKLRRLSSITWKAQKLVKAVIFTALSIAGLSTQKYRNQVRYECARAFAVKFGHMLAWSQFLESKSGWALFLEDDAQLDVKLASDLLLIEKILTGSKLGVVELSRSYSLEELGISSANIVNEEECLSGAKIAQMDQGYANTTCSTAYTRELIVAFLDWISRTSRSKALKNVPVDWLIDLYYCYNPDAIACFHHIPGVFSQGSPFRSRYKKVNPT